MDYSQIVEKRFREALSQLISDEYGCGLPMEVIKSVLESELSNAEAVLKIAPPAR